VKAGGALKTDALNLDVQLSQAREGLIRARNGLQLSVLALNTAVGETVLNEEAVIGLAPALNGVRPPERKTVDVEGRPEWRAAEAQAKAMDALADRARRDYMPSVSAMGSVDWDSEAFTDFQQSYFAGAVAEVNLFDGFRNRSGLIRARANAGAARAELARLRNALRLDLTQAVLGEREAWERLEVSGKSLASAEEALRITWDRYQQGAADVTELMTAQVGLTTTRSRQVAAHYDCLMARANVARAGGELGKGVNHE
jgi:outer membrane protein TolC